MLLNKNYYIKLFTLFVLIISLILIILFSFSVQAASVYDNCYEKDTKSSQKNCIIEQIKKECPKLKNSCVDDEIKKVEKAYTSVLNVCLQKNKNELCNDRFATIENIKNGLNSDLGASADASASTNTNGQAGTLPNEAATQAYSCDGLSKQECLEKNPIVKWINWGINLVAGIVGVGAVLMIIWAGIQYTTARDNAQAVAAAKQKIINVVIGIAAFIFLYAFLNWLVPGGVFK
jgi:ABC-type maltose transport system permease subunit